MEFQVKKDLISVVEKLKNNLYKVTIIFLKCLPMTLGIIVCIEAILAYFSIQFVALNYIMAILLYSFIYITSYVFKFCVYHRMPLHYVVTCNILSFIDTYIGIPVSDLNMLYIYLILLFICIAVMIYDYVKNNKRLSVEDNK